jgi:PAS domain S-box-containing protein
MTTARKLWLGFGLLTGLLVLLGASEVVRLSSAGAEDAVGFSLALTAVAAVIAVATGVAVGRGILRAERSLRDSEERYRTLVEASPQMVWALRPDWSMAFVSHTFTEFTGLTAAQAGTKQDRDALLHPEDLPQFLATIAGPWERGEAHEVVARWRRRDGQYRWTRSRAVPIKDASGAVVLWIGTTADVHEQRLAEEALRKGQEEYRLLVETNPALICRFRDDGTLTFVNDTYCRTFGKSRDELLGRRFLPLVPPEDRPLIFRMLGALVPDMEPYVHEHRVVVADGSVRWQQWTNRSIAGAGGEGEYQAVGIDVTEAPVTRDPGYRAGVRQADHGRLYSAGDEPRGAGDDRGRVCRRGGRPRRVRSGLSGASGGVRDSHSASVRRGDGPPRVPGDGTEGNDSLAGDAGHAVPRPRGLHRRGPGRDA